MITTRGQKPTICYQILTMQKGIWSPNFSLGCPSSENFVLIMRVVFFMDKYNGVAAKTDKNRTVTAVYRLAYRDRLG